MWLWRRKPKPSFSFQPRWKEEMVVTGPGGSFTLYFPMGIPTAVLPGEAHWHAVAPGWARPLWPQLRAELENWCRENEVQFEIDPTGSIW